MHVWRPLQVIVDKLNSMMAERFHHVALLDEFVEAIRHGELAPIVNKIIAMANLRIPLPVPHDGIFFCSSMAITFLVGCLWPSLVSKLRARVRNLKPNKRLDSITLIFNAVFVLLSACTVLARPSESSRWIIMIGFCWRLVVEISRRNKTRTPDRPPVTSSTSKEPSDWAGLYS